VLAGAGAMSERWSVNGGRLDHRSPITDRHRSRVLFLFLLDIDVVADDAAKDAADDGANDAFLHAVCRAADNCTSSRSNGRVALGVALYGRAAGWRRCGRRSSRCTWLCGSPTPRRARGPRAGVSDRFARRRRARTPGASACRRVRVTALGG